MSEYEIGEELTHLWNAYEELDNKWLKAFDNLSIKISDLNQRVADLGVKGHPSKSSDLIPKHVLMDWLEGIEDERLDSGYLNEEMKGGAKWALQRLHQLLVTYGD